MTHAPAASSSPLKSHLGPGARAAIRAGRPETVRVLARLSRNANVDAVIREAERLDCVVRGYLPDSRLLGLFVPVHALEKLARVDGVDLLDADR